ncbi:MAG: hypothetical protein ACYCQI_09895 [Gammaproteobacteria bacterium]
MQTREQKDRQGPSSESDLGERNGYRFCKKIEEIMAAVTQYKLNSSHYKLINECYSKLISAYVKLEPAMKTVEGTRDYPVDPDEDEDILKKQSEVKALEKQINDLEIEFIEKKTSLTKHADALADKEISVDRESLLDKTKGVTELDNAIKERDGYQQDYERIKDNLSCCSCFPCNSTQEKSALKALDVKIKKKNQDIENLRITLHSSDTSKATLEKLVTQEEDDQKKLAQLIDVEMPAKRRDLQAKLKVAKEAFGTASDNLNNKIEDYYSSQSRENMLLYLCVYVYFMDLYQAVEKNYWESFAKVNGVVAKIDELNQFRNKMDEFKKQLDKYFDKLWCDFKRNSGKIIARLFNELDVKEKTLILNGKPDESLLLKLFPIEQVKPALTTITKNSLFSQSVKPVSAIATSSQQLNSVTAVPKRN